jgi:hypothetical protein
MTRQPCWPRCGRPRSPPSRRPTRPSCPPGSHLTLCPVVARLQSTSRGIYVDYMTPEVLTAIRCKINNTPNLEACAALPVLDQARTGALLRRGHDPPEQLGASRFPNVARCRSGTRTIPSAVAGPCPCVTARRRSVAFADLQYRPDQPDPRLAARSGRRADRQHPGRSRWHRAADRSAAHGPLRRHQRPGHLPRFLGVVVLSGLGGNQCTLAGSQNSGGATGSARCRQRCRPGDLLELHGQRVRGARSWQHLHRAGAAPQLCCA